MINIALLPQIIHQYPVMLQCIKESWDSGHIETPGDLSELSDIIKDSFAFQDSHISTPLENLLTVHNYLMAASSHMEYHEAYQSSPLCQAIEHMYPRLYKTLVVWAWG